MPPQAPSFSAGLRGTIQKEIPYREASPFRAGSFAQHPRVAVFELTSQPNPNPLERVVKREFQKLSRWKLSAGVGEELNLDHISEGGMDSCLRKRKEGRDLVQSKGVCLWQLGKATA